MALPGDGDFHEITNKRKRDDIDDIPKQIPYYVEYPDDEENDIAKFHEFHGMNFLFCPFAVCTVSKCIYIISIFTATS